MAAFSREWTIKSILLLISLLITATAQAAPLLTTNFAGIPNTGFYPPDPAIAAGPSNIVAVANSTIAIYTKSGALITNRTLTSWFAGVNPPGAPFSPKVVYDAKAGHWVMLALSSGNPRLSYYLISVSLTSDAAGSWWIWIWDAGRDGSTASGNTADSAALGYDSDEAIYITSNQFDNHDTFQYAKLRIIPKSQLYSGSAVLNGWDFWDRNNANGTKVFGWKPAQAQSTLAGNYLINTAPAGSNFISLWKVTNPLGTNPGPTVTLQGTLAVRPYALPGNAAQKGGTATLNTGDCRAQDVQFQNGKLVTALTEGYNWSTGPVSAIRALVVDAINNAVNVDSRFGADKLWHYYPSIVRDPAGNMAMVFNRSGTNEFAGAYYTAWLAGETNWQASAELKAGQAFYGSSGNALWGNYNGAALDPANASRAWLNGEYAVSATQWGTWIGQVSLATAVLTNDQCVGAIALTNGLAYSMSTSSATATNDPTTVCGLGVGKGVWFSVSPTTTGPVLVSTCGSDFSTVLQVYGGSCLSLAALACNAGSGPACSGAQASLQFNAIAGTTYRVFVGGAGGASGNLTITTYWPGNDICSGAVPLTNGAPYTINTASAGSVGEPAPSCGSGVTKGVWFSFTSQFSGDALISTCGSDFDTVLQVYSGTCGSLISVVCNDNNGILCSGTRASLKFFVTAGTTYLVFSGGASGTSGNLNIVVYSPANDICAGANPLPPGSVYRMNTSSAGSQTDPPLICGLSVGKGVWFSYISPGNGQATITTCGSDYNTAVVVYRGSCGSLTEVDCNTGFGPPCFTTEAGVQFQASAGVNYLIFAAGLGSASGNLVISNGFCQAPSFSSVSSNAFLTPAGVVVSATVSSPGTPPYLVHWSIGPFSADIVDSPNVSFLIPLDKIPDYLTSSNFSSIFVTVSNGCGFAGGSGGFLSPCVVCLSRGIPVSSSSVANSSGGGPNLPTSCGNLGFASKWFDLASVDNGMADIGLTQSAPTNCFVSVFAGNDLLSAVAVTNACTNTIATRQTRLQFPVTANQHYYLVVTNAGAITNMTYGFVPRISGALNRTNRQYQLKSGVGPALSYTFQASTALTTRTTWSNLYSATFPTNGATYNDTMATNFGRRFYRIAPGP